MKKVLFLAVFSLICVAGLSALKAQAMSPDGSDADINSMIADRVSNGSNLLNNDLVTSNTGNNQGLILFRIVRNCADGTFHYGSETSVSPLDIRRGYVRYGQLNEYDLQKYAGGSYFNYTCGDRYQQQCINDGSFDTYYQEVCVREPAAVNVSRQSSSHRAHAVTNSANASYSTYAASTVNTNGSYPAEPVIPAGQDIRSLISSTYGSNYLNNQVTNPTYNNNNGLILFRITRSCATGAPIGQYYSNLTEFNTAQWILGNLAMVDLTNAVGGQYYNYTCGSRYKEQCIDDGSFDTYYDEFCSQNGVNLPSYSNNVSVPVTNTTITSSASIPAGDKILYRTVRDCGTGNPLGANYPSLTQISAGQYASGQTQIIDLNVFQGGSYTNYTCGSRYQEQCINDGSFDSYYDESCTN